MLKLSLIASAVVGLPVAASDLDLVNAFLNVGAVLAILFAILMAPRAFKAKTAQADLAEKDRTIATWEQTNTALEKRLAATQAAHEEQVAEYAVELRHVRERSVALAERAAEFQARYEELEKYAAKEAFGSLQAVLNAQAHESERRHLETMGVLAALQEAVGERRASVLVDPPE